MKLTIDTTSPLGRPLDPTYPSNVFVVVTSVAMAITFAIAEFVLGLSPASPWWVAGGSGFLAWAITRELDPDHTLSGGFAMAVMAVLAAMVQAPLLFAFGVLSGLRLVAGTVGLPMRSTDALAVIGIGGLVGFGDLGTVAALALGLGAVVIGRGSARAVAVAAASVLAALVVSVVRGTAVPWEAPGSLAVALMAMATIALLFSVPAPAPSAQTDVGSKSLSPSRLTTARWAAWVLVVVAFALQGGPGVEAAATLVAASTGVALNRLWLAAARLLPQRQVGSLS